MLNFVAGCPKVILYIASLTRMNSLTAVCLLASFLLLLSASPAVSVLNCSALVTCRHGSVATCQCVEAVGSLEWTVLPGDDCTVTYNTIDPRPPVGAVTSLCNDGHTVVLDAEGTNSFGTF